jgi:phosphoadenosine phosphosulfate reductase
MTALALPSAARLALADLEQAETREILEWAYANFDPERIGLSTAFGPSGVALMHLASEVHPGAKVFFVDTGFHFAETLEMIDRVRQRLPVQVQVIEPKLTVEEQADRYGDELYVINSDQCCAMRKVEPTQRMLKGLDVWFTALRRDQGPSRANTPVVQHKTVDGRPLLKVAPMVRWTRQDVWAHVFEHDLPYNPLHDQNYPSVGCWPCTKPVMPGQDERAGRWAGKGKTECGLHTMI